MSNHIKRIIEANNDNRLAIFVGAGISKSSDTANDTMPLWTTIIDELKNDLEKTNEQDYLKIAQLYYLEFGEYSYYDKLKKLFQLNLKPSVIHKLIFEIRPQYVITTNWDKLLDDTVINNAFMYDIITSDEDLVKSTTQKKLIKMHGDFEHHNIVFKEDDYLNYTNNFPLIENFIKSILSTHTILFTGYSYGDYNLKQMVKWIQSFSKVKPPAYLVAFKSNNSEIKYLENHGITSLILDDNNVTKKDKIENFLLKIKNKNYILNNKINDDNVIDYFYNILLPFDKLNILMPEQIEKVLQKTYMIYEDKFIVIDFINLLESDIFYKKFKNLLSLLNKGKLDKKFLEHNQSKFDKIFKILSKAGIGGIVLNSEEYYPFKCSLYNGLNLDNIIEFKLDIYNKNDLIQKAFIVYQLNDNEKAYLLYEDIIKQSLKSKNYSMLFLSLFNRNTLLKILKWDFTIDFNKYSDILEYDIEEKYQDVPNNIKKIIAPIILVFKDVNFIYSFVFKVSSLLKKAEGSKRTIENGGMVFSNNSKEANLKHENLLYFILGNGLAIEKYTEFQTIIEYFINISINEQVQRENIILSKLELYSVIKYIKVDNIKIIFKEFSEKESKKKLHLDNDLQQLLLNMLDNIIGHIDNKSTNIFPQFEDYWEKTIFLLSISKLNTKIINLIIDNFVVILNLSKNSTSIYKSINLFLGKQYSLYETSIDNQKLIDLLELILSKIIYKRYGEDELRAIKDNRIGNLYGYLGIRHNKKFNNEVLIDKLLLELNSWDNVQKIGISTYFLISLYNISNDEIRKKIKEFINNIKYNRMKANYIKIDFQLFLLENNFINKASKQLKININKEIEPYRDGKSMSSHLSRLKYRLKHLVDKKNMKIFKELLDELVLLIDSFNNKNKKSSIKF